MRAVPKRRRLRLGTIFLLLGVLSVLGVTFAVGALAGRFSLRPSASLASASKPADRAPKPSAPAQPELTFYRELTAPLVPAPLPPKASARPVPKREPASARFPDASARPIDASPRPADARAEPVNARDGAGAPPSSPSSPPDGARYTVQVAAYNARAQADALRARLVTAGHDAYVTEGETAAGTRYRVRIGTYASAEEARQAAGRIGAQAHVPTYVTTR
jgi:DedD protein